MKLSFKNFLNEISDPAAPSNRVSSRKKVRDAGTARATNNFEYKFKTKLQNAVTIYFRIDGDDSYNVVFYVNDTLNDRASQTETSTRDPEILPGVIYVIDKKADQIAAKEIKFSAFSGEGDTKSKFGISVDPHLAKTDKLLDQFVDALNRHKITMVEPSQSLIALYARLKQPTPLPAPDLNVKAWIKSVDQFRASIKAGQFYPACEQFANDLSSTALQAAGIDVKSLVEAIKELEGAMWSNTPHGWRQTRNRREAVYEQLVRRHFSSKWDVAKDGDKFVLTRKINP